MREVAALTFITLDGVMQGPGSPGEDSSDGFTQGGWAVEYWDEVMRQVMTEAMADPYDLLLGRRTYELFAAYWPKANGDNPVAKRLNGARKHVVTASTTTPLDWQPATRLNGDVAEEVTKLKTQNGPLLQIHGSWGLIRTLLAHDLIDEFRLWTFPVVLGKGKRLFDSHAIPTSLKLVKSDTTSTGVVMGVYRRRA